MSVQIIAFEGLGLGTPTFIKRGLLDKLDLSECEVWRGSFMSAGPEPIECDKRIVIGHSMGGASAITWCRKWEASVDLLLTLDPRPLHRPYIKRVNVKRAVNFYRNSFWMTGYPVEGAENNIVKCGHTVVPSLHEVVELMRGSL